MSIKRYRNIADEDRGNSTDKVLLSVIMPVYNPPIDLLSEMLESILAQSFENYEVLIVDDGNDEDLAKEIVNALPSDSRFRVLRREHAGVSAARNAGIEATSGRYFTFVDADDRLYPSFFESSVSALENTGADMAMGLVEGVYDRGCNLSSAHKKSSLWKYSGEKLDAIRSLFVAGYPRDSISYLGKFSVFLAAAKVFRRKTIGSLRLDEGLSFGEDALYNAMAAYQSGCIVVVDEPWYEYFRRQGSVTHGKAKDFIQKLADVSRYRAIVKDFGWDENDVAVHCAILAIRVLKGSVCDLPLKRIREAYLGLCSESTRSLLKSITLRGYSMPQKRRLLISSLKTGCPTFVAALLKIWLATEAHLMRSRRGGGD